MKQKVLFLDRDGTLILEPPTDFQVDSLDKLSFYPGVFRWLSQIASEMDYILVMVTNQDGLGTDSFPEESFWPAHNKMLQAFVNEGIHFSEVLIDRSFPKENLNTRKPGTGLLQKYIYGDFDLENSFVIGDRLSDVELAQNLNCKSVLISNQNDNSADLCTTSWQEIYTFLKGQKRQANIKRKTNETNISIALNLDGQGTYDIETGLPFFNHMLEQLAKHANLDLEIKATGDLHIDEHHTIEDVGLALGEAFLVALGTKKGIERYG
ncbi:MAG: histidinol-phosphatase, partial [Saprospiraceae bacterium]|nr:histidinol-phosphatase [Saprospiraceae bacterium]